MAFTDLIDLASEKLGAAVVFANDDFFARKENLIRASEPVWKEGLYTDDGKWMDGWETRRRRSPRLDEKFDWCIVRLGMPGQIKGVVVDTAFFRGNYPSHCSIEALSADVNATVSELEHGPWSEILPVSELKGDTKNLFDISSEERVTHLRFRIYPDGGVARLRVHGRVLPDWKKLRARNSEIDLAAAENGGDVPLASDMFFGHRHNLIMPGTARDMSDGWESQRRRGSGHDWCIVKLGAAGTLTRAVIDTAFFKGNYPESCSLEGGTAVDGDLGNVAWRELMPEKKLQGHARHSFDELTDVGPITHVRFNIFPDGGVSRLRLFGRIA